NQYLRVVADVTVGKAFHLGQSSARLVEVLVALVEVGARYRKLYALTGQSPSDCIRTLRLRRGAELLAQKAGNVSEVAYRVGFKEPSYFSRCFSQAYGCSPSEYRSANAPSV
ncbi:MAG: helix-turn-helix transcriptional regulator, partial [Cytophagales bacterium]|nr:helix-turn-helix transcriptional regulator [Cytophagales bacterium]